MFDDNVMTKANELNKQKIVTILSRYEFSMNKTLKLMKQLPCLENGNQGADPILPGSPSRTMVGESRGAMFKAPQEQIQSPQTGNDQVMVLAEVQSSSIFGPPRTIADLMSLAEAEPTSPGASVAQQVCPIPLTQTEVIGVTITRRESKEKTVMEEVTCTVLAATAPLVGNVVISLHQRELAGTEWMTSLSPYEHIRVVRDRVFTPSPMARDSNCHTYPRRDTCGRLSRYFIRDQAHVAEEERSGQAQHNGLGFR